MSTATKYKRSSKPAAILAEHAAEIRKLGKRVFHDVHEIGRHLSEAKEIAGHGKWGAWLHREFGWNERTAQNFMSVHARLKSEKFSDLDIPVSGLYLLAAQSTPEKARAAVIERAEAGERVTFATVKETVAAATKPRMVALRVTKDAATEPRPITLRITEGAPITGCSVNPPPADEPPVPARPAAEAAQEVGQQADAMEQRAALKGPVRVRVLNQPEHVGWVTAEHLALERVAVPLQQVRALLPGRIDDAVRRLVGRIPQHQLAAWTDITAWLLTFHTRLKLELDRRVDIAAELTTAGKPAPDPKPARPAELLDIPPFLDRRSTSAVEGDAPPEQAEQLTEH